VAIRARAHTHTHTCTHTCSLLAAPCTYGDSTPVRAAPLQGRTMDSWFAVVVGCRIVEPRSLSMIGIDTLAHIHTLEVGLLNLAV
jgi:hypothetical protein